MAISITWTEKIPQKSGYYLTQKNGHINIMFVSVKDMDLQEKEGGWLDDIDYWSTEEVEVN